MLVLTRKRMEKLYIGGDICVTVVRLEGSQVRLGIDAPRHVPVVRAELKARDQAEAEAEAEAEPHKANGTILSPNPTEPASKPAPRPKSEPALALTRPVEPNGKPSRIKLRQRKPPRAGARSPLRRRSRTKWRPSRSCF